MKKSKVNLWKKPERPIETIITAIMALAFIIFMGYGAFEALSEITWRGYRRFIFKSFIVLLLAVSWLFIYILHTTNVWENSRFMQWLKRPRGDKSYLASWLEKPIKRDIDEYEKTSPFVRSRKDIEEKRLFRRVIIEILRGQPLNVFTGLWIFMSMTIFTILFPQD